MVSVDRCNGSYDTLDSLFGRICVLNKPKDINLNAFNMIARINEVKTLIKPCFCDFKCKFNDAKCDSNQKQNNDKCQ